MAGRSSIDRLAPAVRERLDAEIRRGATIDEIVGMLLDLQSRGQLAESPSRSAVGRYSQQYRQLAARQRDMASVAKAFAGEFGDADDLQGRLMIQLVTSLITRVAMSAAEDEEVELDVKELHFLARAVKDATSASKTDVDREKTIRAEEAKRARAAAAADAESAAKAAGASPETIDLIKRRILGIGG